MLFSKLLVQRLSTWRLAAERGHPAAQFLLGNAYAYGIGTAKDTGIAHHWIQKAAEQGLAPAQASLGVYYANLQKPESDSQAVAWYRKAAEQGLTVAQFLLGLMYEDGRGVPESDSEAAIWYRKAAEQGYAIAQVSLGHRFEKGRGVPQSVTEAALVSKGRRARGSRCAGEPRDNVHEWSRRASERF